MSKIRVLIVDDSPFIHKAISRALAAGDFEVCGIGSNGKEGAELYAKLKPDLVTMDITMPIMDGLDSARLIVKSDPAAKIVMLSAMGDEELMKSAKDIGIRVFLQKPFKSDEMMKAIAQVMGASGA